jgi:hypothetical protein
MTNRISIDSNDIAWQPAHEVFSGYRLDTVDPEAGVFVKVLRAPADGGGCSEDTTALVHYHDAPDEILRAEVIERVAS